MTQQFWHRVPPRGLSVSTFFLLVGAAGAQAVSVAWPFAESLGGWLPMGLALPWVQLAAMVVFVAVLDRCQTPVQGALAGGVFATAWLCGVFWWLYVAMHTYGGLHSLLALAGVLALALALAVYYAVAAAVYVRWRGQNASWAGVLFAALWLGAEMARGTWLTGFGWGAVGYAHWHGPLAAAIPWLGVYGVSALAAWLAASGASVLAKATQGRRLGLAAPASVAWGPWLGVGVLCAGVLVGAAQVAPRWTVALGSVQVSLLQGNIPQDEKFEMGSGVPLALDWYAKQLLQSTSTLVVAPETAIPLLPQQLPDDYLQNLQARFTTGSQALLTGIPLGSFSAGYTNSVMGIAPHTDTAWRYDKHHLVPFGEFIPPLFKWFTQLMHIPLGDFNRGDLEQSSFAWAGQRLAAHICYEDLFGEELAVRFVNPALAPTIFVNVSNMGWFGDSVAMDQHLNIARMRALEFERPFLRATNTGATVIMDHQAKVVAALPRASRGVLHGQVQGRDGLTPFAWWASRWGLWPLWIFVAAVVGAAWMWDRKQSKALLN
jgi:apolipoprotein N-acyltransferase